jgi:hypothetical protein
VMTSFGITHPVTTHHKHHHHRLTLARFGGNRAGAAAGVVGEGPCACGPGTFLNASSLCEPCAIGTFKDDFQVRPHNKHNPGVAGPFTPPGD